MFIRLTLVQEEEEEPAEKEEEEVQRSVVIQVQRAMPSK